MHASDVGLWPLGPEDLPDIQRLLEKEGRNVHPEEYGRFLELEGAGGFVMRSNEELRGAVTTMRHFEHAFLGPIIAGASLSPALNIALLSEAVERLLRGGATRVEVEAAPEEARLLASLGFEPVRETLVMERPPGVFNAPPETGPRALMARDLLDIGALDALAVGYGRKEYLVQLANAFREGALVDEEGGEVAGFAFLRRSRRGYHLGPLVTADPSPQRALRLASAAVARVASWPVVALVPEDAHFADALAALGFARVGHLVRMRAGAPAASPGASEWVIGGRLTG